MIHELALIILLSSCCLFTPAPIILKSPSALLAHHVNKKITKRMMDRRPKKTRPSDIHRNNVNFGKCITKVVGAPPDYTIVAEKGEF